MRVIDLFAGAGGSSEGARMAGARVVWAANHWRLAVEQHARNHPDVEHVCQDLHQCTWQDVPRCDLVLASPACQGHSKAASRGGRGRRGRAPRHDADRSTAWAVVSCLEVTRAPVAVVENVAEFRRWSLFPSWCDALKRLGYTASEHLVDAADLGVPQRRERLFVVLTRSRAPLRLELPTLPRVAHRSIIDEVADARGWKAIEKLPASAQIRIRRAVDRHGACSVNYVSDDMGHDLDAPITTITTKHQRAWIRVRGRHIERRMFAAREYLRAQGFGDGYTLTGKVTHDVRLIGNAVPPPVMAAIITAIARAA